MTLRRLLISRFSVVAREERLKCSVCIGANKVLSRFYSSSTPLKRLSTHDVPPSITKNRHCGLSSTTSPIHVWDQPHSSQPLPNPTPSFDSAQVAFASKTNKELLRAALSFRLCQWRFLVNHSEFLLQLTRRILGDTIMDWALKATLYGHFCAGEDEKRIQPVIQAMEKNGIGSILDYVAEADEQGSENTTLWSMLTTKSTSKSKLEEISEIVLRENDPKARVYEYTDEAGCDRHVETFKKCIRDVAALQADGYAAIKVSALVNPKLLARMSRAILEAQNLFAKFDTDQDGLISRQEFERGFNMFFKDDQEKMTRMLDQLALEELGGMIDYLSWSMLLRPQDLPQITNTCHEIGPLAMVSPTDEELEMIDRMYDRMHSLAKEAAKVGTRLLIDAEQALYQPAIDNVVLELQRAYNQEDSTSFPVIYNTYQCYLKDSSDRLRNDANRSRRNHFHFGAKLVRGAYMESENALAQKLGYPSPIHKNIYATHACYDDSVRFLLEQSKSSKNKIEIMLASHNQESIQKAITVMNELGINRQDSTICFAQLYGMTDNVTYALGKEGYRVFKYVPYGEVKMAIPYLVRRAKENSSIASGAKRELEMIHSELWRRVA